MLPANGRKRSRGNSSTSENGMTRTARCALSRADTRNHSTCCGNSQEGQRGTASETLPGLSAIHSPVRPVGEKGSGENPLLRPLGRPASRAGKVVETKRRSTCGTGTGGRRRPDYRPAGKPLLGKQATKGRQRGIDPAKLARLLQDLPRYLEGVWPWAASGESTPGGL